VPDIPRAVVITGMGAVTPAGVGVEVLWAALRAGHSLARSVPALLESATAATIACVVPADAEVDRAPSLLEGKAARRADRFSQLAAIAAGEAIAAAGIGGGGTGTTDVDPSRAGVIVGTGIGGIGTTIEQGKRHVAGRPTNPLVIPMVMPNAAAALLAMQLGWTGPSLAIATACASGAHAIGEASRLVRHGEADVVLAGGAEAPVHPFVVKAFADLTALSTRNDEPALASRPFDQARDGFVIGEGACFCILESEAHAFARGATVLGRIEGYARNADAYHLVMPEPSGRGAASCIEQALTDAGMSPADIAWVSAHGTSTPYNDAAEATALERVFGTRQPPVTATKGVCGHLIGAAGALQVVAAVASLADGWVAPIANLDDPDPAFGTRIDLVRDAPRSMVPGPVLTSAFAFGGHNAALVVSPP